MNLENIWIIMKKNKKVFVHISMIEPGDTILHKSFLDTEEVLRTVCKSNIKPDDGFIGMSIFGDSYHSGHKLVCRVDNLSF